MLRDKKHRILEEPFSSDHVRLILQRDMKLLQKPSAWTPSHFYTPSRSAAAFSLTSSARPQLLL